MVDQTISVTGALYQEDLYQIPGKVLVVLSKAWQDVTDDERMVLSKMLGALKLSLAAVQIVSLQNLSLKDITSFSSEKVLVFGSSVAEVSRTYELTQANGISVIVADPVDKLDDAKKKTLWLELRKMFGI